MKWLYIYGVDGLSVSGGGTIDGSGQQWWASTCKRKKTPVITDRPAGFNQQPPNLSGLFAFSALMMKSPEFSEPRVFVLSVCSLATRGLVQR